MHEYYALLSNGKQLQDIMICLNHEFKVSHCKCGFSWNGGCVLVEVPLSPQWLAALDAHNIFIFFIFR